MSWTSSAAPYEDPVYGMKDPRSCSRILGMSTGETNPHTASTRALLTTPVSSPLAGSDVADTHKHDASDNRGGGSTTGNYGDYLAPD